MTHIISPDNLLAAVKTFHEECPPFVLAGGCFDILHIGHVRFLHQAKQLGKKLVILLESDATVKRLKGARRPYFTQQERAEMLSQLRSVDVVICLPPMDADHQYIDLVQQLHPDVIAVTEGDPSQGKKEEQAAKIGATVAVISHIQTHSTSSLAQLLGVD